MMNYSNLFRRIIALGVLASTLHASAAEATSPKTTPGSFERAVDWKSFMERNDPVWNKVPDKWEDGAFIGNGRLGAMIYKGSGEPEPVAKVIGWTVGRSDVYDERDPNNHFPGSHRVPIGRFHLLPVGTNASGKLRIDLWNGEANGTIKTDQGSIRWHSWVQDEGGDPNSGIIVIDVQTDEGEKNMSWEWKPMKSTFPRSQHHQKKMEWEANPPGHQVKIDDANVWVQPFKVGGDYSTAWMERKHSDLHRTLYIAVGYALHKGGSAETAAKAVKAAYNRDLHKMQEAHRQWWNAFCQRSFVSIPNARFESHYWIQLYKLGSATRSGSVVPDLSGPWLKCNTQWAAVWWNLNMQLTYYPVAVANHVDLHEPLIRLLKQELDNGNLKRNVPENHGRRDESAYFGNPTTVHNLINKDLYWGRKKSLRLNHLPWICHTNWEAYRRTMDDKMLRESLFPLTRAAFTFIFPYITERGDGRLTIRETYSSEYGRAHDANEALAMIRWGCHALLWMTERLGIDDPDIPRWKDIQARLVDAPVDANGLMVGSDVPFAHSHRHYSHLMAIVPFRMWDISDPAKKEVAERSLKHWLSLNKALQGYSFTGASKMYSYLGDGDKALAMLQNYFRRFDKPNTMYTEGSSPVIETPLSVARAVQDMLLQSHDVIRVFPAIPSSWKDAAFDSLLAEGAFEVGAVRKDGKTQFVRIRSLAGEPCKVKTDLVNPVRMGKKGQEALNVDTNGIITLKLAKGEEAILAPSGYAGDLQMQAIANDPKSFNFYGQK